MIGGGCCFQTELTLITLATWLFPAPGRPLSMMTICGHSPLMWGGRDRGGGGVREGEREGRVREGGGREHDSERGREGERERGREE